MHTVHRILAVFLLASLCQLSWQQRSRPPPFKPKPSTPTPTTTPSTTTETPTSTVQSTLKKVIQQFTAKPISSIPLIENPKYKLKYTYYGYLVTMSGEVNSGSDCNEYSYNLRIDMRDYTRKYKLECYGWPCKTDEGVTKKKVDCKMYFPSYKNYYPGL